MTYNFHHWHSDERKNERKKKEENQFRVRFTFYITSQIFCFRTLQNVLLDYTFHQNLSNWVKNTSSLKGLKLVSEFFLDETSFFPTVFLCIIALYNTYYKKSSNSYSSLSRNSFFFLISPGPIHFYFDQYPELLLLEIICYIQ